MQDLYVATCAIGLFAVGMWHVVQGEATERMFQKRRNVQLLGVVLLVLALPCALWRGAFFSAFGTALGLSGALRLCMPAWNIRMQKKAYPRWVHGWIMMAGAVGSWLIFRIGSS